MSEKVYISPLDALESEADLLCEVDLYEEVSQMSFQVFKNSPNGSYGQKRHLTSVDGHHLLVFRCRVQFQYQLTQYKC
jgi:hypothetical protein